MQPGPVTRLRIGDFAQFLFDLQARLALLADHARRELTKPMLDAIAGLSQAHGQRAFGREKGVARLLGIPARGGGRLFRQQMHPLQ